MKFVNRVRLALDKLTGQAADRASEPVVVFVVSAEECGREVGVYPIRDGGRLCIVVNTDGEFPDVLPPPLDGLDRGRVKLVGVNPWRM